MEDLKIWFTSDTHFGHRNIIKYCQRPYRTDTGDLDVEAMNRDMVKRWNEVVGPLDTVYHLGDFAFMKEGPAKDVLSKLNGKKHLIRGNHDRTACQMKCMGFETVQEKLDLVIGEYTVHMCHYPADYPGPPKYPKHVYLCGHVHEAWKTRYGVINVGVDQWDMKPVSLETLLGALDVLP